jgi:hypothetical protein
MFFIDAKGVAINGLAIRQDMLHWIQDNLEPRTAVFGVLGRDVVSTVQ